MRQKASSIIYLSTWVLSATSGALYASNSPAVERQPSKPVQYNVLQLPSARVAATILQRPAAILWEQQPVRAGLHDISQSHKISIWLDRRIDPTQRLDFQPSGDQPNRTLEATLNAIAEKMTAEAGLIENVVYIGPIGQLDKLQRAHVLLHNAIATQKGSSDTQLRPLAWQELATPTEVLLSIQSDWQITGEAALPHDLLHAGELKACCLATQLTLICAGFDRQAEIAQGQTVTLKPLEEQISWRYLYDGASLDVAAIQRGNFAKVLRGHKARLRRNGTSFEVTGPTQIHLALLKQSSPVEKVIDFEKQEWTLEVENKPVKVVLDSLASSIGFELQWSPDVSAQEFERLISFKVMNGKLDDLLQAVAQAATLDIARVGLSVKISVPSPNNGL